MIEEHHMTKNDYAAKCADLMKLKLDENRFFGFYEVEEIASCQNSCSGRLCLNDGLDGRLPINVCELRCESKNA